MQKILAALALTALLLTPALPARAAGPADPGFVHWLQSWVDGALSWVTGATDGSVEADATAPESGSEPGSPQVVPLDTVDTESDDTEQGPRIDPAG